MRLRWCSSQHPASELDGGIREAAGFALGGRPQAPGVRWRRKPRSGKAANETAFAEAADLALHNPRVSGTTPVQIDERPVVPRARHAGPPGWR